MTFKKGNIPWNKGKPGIYTEETLMKMREAQIGKKRKPFTEEHKQRIRESKIGEKNPMYGKTHSDEMKKKIIESRKWYRHSEETKKKISEGNKGKVITDEMKKKISISLKGHTSSKKGTKLSLETKKKISISVKRNPPRYWLNKKRSDVTIKKIIESRKEYYKKNPQALKRLGRHMLGKESIMKNKHHSEKSKKKLSDSLKEYYIKNPEAIEKYKKWRTNFILPKKDTKIEVKIQMFLKELDYEFFTHQYMKIEHGYQCDILIPALNLVIECDGDYWHKYPIGLEKDHIRTKELLEKGFKVLRLWECEIKEMSIDKFKEDLDIIKMEIGK